MENKPFPLPLPIQQLCQNKTNKKIQDLLASA
jgi:hypothetical protein